jgi:hypothetical protein
LPFVIFRSFVSSLSDENCYKRIRSLHMRF